jgi:hypothetical protein
MSRSTLLVIAALACAALALPVCAGAMSAPQTCTAYSANVVGGKVVGTLTSSNVDPSQARFATCKQAKKAMARVTELGVEEPRPVAAFYCRPTVSGKAQNVVSYICTFRGADTATFIKLTFKVTYKAPSRYEGT